MIVQKRDQSYSRTMSWLRCSLSFALLHSSIQCLRGARSAGGWATRKLLPPVDLVTLESHFNDQISFFFSIMAFGCKVLLLFLFRLLYSAFYINSSLKKIF